MVAASAALLVELGRDSGRSTDPRLIKAVLLNSAHKLAGWEQEIADHPSRGIRINSTPLDPAQGAGMIDLSGAYMQYVSAEGEGAGPGFVERVGWDVNNVVKGTANQYFFNTQFAAGSQFTATLVWFMDRMVEEYDHTAEDPFPSTFFYNDNLDDLDLYLYRADGSGNLTGEAIAASISNWDIENPDFTGGFDTVEHLHLIIPETGYYALSVVWDQTIFYFHGDGFENETYALAWYATPEPGTVLMLLLGIVVLLTRRQSRV